MKVNQDVPKAGRNVPCLLFSLIKNSHYIFEVVVYIYRADNSKVGKNSKVFPFPAHPLYVDVEKSI
jgi:hypothetical protein